MNKSGVGLSPHAVVAGEIGEGLHPLGKTPGLSDYAPGEKQWMLERLDLRGCRLQGVLAEAGRGRPCMGDSAGQPEESCEVRSPSWQSRPAVQRLQRPVSGSSLPLPSASGLSPGYLVAV